MTHGTTTHQMMSCAQHVIMNQTTHSSTGYSTGALIAIETNISSSMTGTAKRRLPKYQIDPLVIRNSQFTIQKAKVPNENTQSGATEKTILIEWMYDDSELDMLEKIRDGLKEIGVKVEWVECKIPDHPCLTMKCTRVNT